MEKLTTRLITIADVVSHIPEIIFFVWWMSIDIVATTIGDSVSFKEYW